LYATDGATDDFGYGDLGVAAYTFELGPEKDGFFTPCTTFENTILPANLPALLYAARAARTPYLTPSGPDALNITISPGLYFISDTIQIHATLDDTRFRNTNGTEPTQVIAAARFSIDLPPWITSTVSSTITSTLVYTMGASDGAFDSKIEAVAGEIDLSLPGLGRHTIFVQGQDAAGNWGPLSAIFIHVNPGWRAYLPALNR
jgi:carboxypeptidase T